MKSKASLSALLAVLTCVSFVYPALAQVPPVKRTTIQSVKILDAGEHFEMEIDADARPVPRVVVVHNPERIELHFNADGSRQLKNSIINRAGVRGIRFSNDEPGVQTITIDLLTPLPYQLFPSGNTLIVKLSPSNVVAGGQPTPSPVASTNPTSASAAPGLSGVAASPSSSAAFNTEFDVVDESAGTSTPAPASVQVQFNDGKLSIVSDKATLAQVLTEIQKQTGAEIAIPPGADQEQVVANLGPGPAREVLASLLNGSRFNFIMVGSDSDPSQLKSVILSPKNSSPPGA